MTRLQQRAIGLPEPDTRALQPSVPGKATPIPKPGIFSISKHMVTASRNAEPVGVFLDSNENAFGPSPHARSAAISAASSLERYVENQERLLVPALARHYSLDPDRIAIGCGSDDILVRLSRAYLRRGSELLRSRNSYLKVPNYAHGNEAVPVAASDEGFAVVVDSMLAAASPKTSMVYVASPDNPSGSCMAIDELRRLHDGLPPDVLLVVDCAYAEYVDGFDACEVFRLVEEAGNVVATRTFSKVFGLAGARVGWMYGPPEVSDAVSRLCLTFPLSLPSIYAALAALQDRRHVEFVVRENRRLRSKFAEAFSGMGLKVYPSQANFLLLEFPEGCGTALGAWSFLRGCGIAVRRFTAPAYNACLRITIGFEGDLRAAEAAMAEYLSGSGAWRAAP